MRGFEKISFEQFKKDILDDNKIYEEYNLPKRSTKYSAGYDFNVLSDYVIKPGEIVKIPTGIKSYMGEDEVLFIVIRSSLGFKYNARLCNQVGVIDKDYYNNENNEGHIWIALKNEGDKDIVLNKGDHFAQGIFMKYLTVDDEEEIKSTRTGGFGSTNKGEC